MTMPTGIPLRDVISIPERISAGDFIVDVTQSVQDAASASATMGLSATVGNPPELLHWLQGSCSGQRPACVVAPEVTQPGSRPAGEVTLDHVGSVGNAAKVVASLHRGEKR